MKRYDLSKKRPQALLVGNGVLRSSNSEYSWNNIIAKLATNDVAIANFEDVPYGIKATAVTDVDDKLRRAKYANIFANYPYETMRTVELLLDINFNAILTTNYTYEIEEHLSKRWSKLSSERKRANVFSTVKRKDHKYLIHTYNRLLNRSGIVHDIWHIHGELRNKSSIILTHDEYARLTAKEVEYFDNRKNCFEKEFYNFGVKSWMDYFIIGDLYILGQGLDYAEFDLWWLLNRRMREKMKYGRIIFYEGKYEDVEKQNLLDQKVQVLNRLDVEHRDCGMIIRQESDYSEFYMKAILDIRNEIAKRETII